MRCRRSCGTPSTRPPRWPGGATSCHRQRPCFHGTQHMTCCLRRSRQPRRRPYSSGTTGSRPLVLVDEVRLVTALARAFSDELCWSIVRHSTGGTLCTPCCRGDRLLHLGRCARVARRALVLERPRRRVLSVLVDQRWIVAVGAPGGRGRVSRPVLGRGVLRDARPCGRVTAGALRCGESAVGPSP